MEKRKLFVRTSSRKKPSICFNQISKVNRLPTCTVYVEIRVRVVLRFSRKTAEESGLQPMAVEAWRSRCELYMRIYPSVPFLRVLFLVPCSLFTSLLTNGYLLPLFAPHLHTAVRLVVMQNVSSPSATNTQRGRAFLFDGRSMHHGWLESEHIFLADRTGSI